METFSVFLKKIALDSKDAQGVFKNSLIEVLCIDEDEAEEIIQTIPGVIEKDLSKPAADAIADIFSSIGAVVEVQNSIDSLTSLHEFEDEAEPEPEFEPENIFESEPEVEPEAEPELEFKPDITEIHSAADITELTDTDDELRLYNIEPEPEIETPAPEPEKKEDDKDFDFDFSGLSLEDDDEPTTPLSKIIKNDEESLLDLALAFEESQNKLKSVPFTNKDSQVVSEAKEEQTKVEQSRENFALELDTPTPTKDDTPLKQNKKETKPEVENNNIQEIQKSLNEAIVKNTATKEATEQNTIDVDVAVDIDIVREKVIPKTSRKRNYPMAVSGLVAVILAIYFLIPSGSEPSKQISGMQTSGISPEVVQQLINAQKPKKTQSKIKDELLSSQKKVFESRLSNELWEMKTRVESTKGSITTLDLQFSAHKIPLPEAEEYVKKQFIPRIVTIGMTFRGSGTGDTLSNNINVSSRIYTKIGTKRKRFTVPLTAELNEAGKILTLYSDKNHQSIPPGTYTIEPTDKNPDSITPKIYFIIPLTQQEIKEVISKEPESKISVKKK